MKCNKVQDLLSAYVDEMLPLVLLLRVRQHLRRCASCRKLTGELEAAKAILKMAPVPPARDGFWEEAYRSLEANVRVRRRRASARRRLSLRPFLALAAALIALLVIPSLNRESTGVPVAVEDMVREHATYSSTRSTADPARFVLTASDIDGEKTSDPEQDYVIY